MRVGIEIGPASLSLGHPARAPEEEERIWELRARDIRGDRGRGFRQGRLWSPRTSP